MKILGIDLGTTNSVVAHYTRGETEILQIGGKTTVPSVVYRHDGNSEVGSKAKQRVLIHPERVLTSTKRQMGGDWSKTIEGETFSAPQAAREILAYLKREAEALLGDTVSDVVITIPAYFDDAQRADTKAAAEQAGFNVLRLLPEPTAAAIAYGLDKEKNQTILVFDLGGGTFDVSILEVEGNRFTVKAVDGNNRLGGDDFDEALVDHLNDRIEEQYGRSLREDSLAQQKLKEAAEEAKIALSGAKSTEISVSGLAPGVSLDIERFTRSEYEALIQPFLDEIVSRTQSVIDQAEMTLDDISRIVLVGGSSKAPIITEMVRKHFRQPFQADNMDTYVARGAAIVCASLLSPTESSEQMFPVDLDFQDVISHSLGTRLFRSGTSDYIYVPILKKNSRYPARAAILAYTIEFGQRSVLFKVLRGEDPDPANNTDLGELNLPITTKLARKNKIPVSAIFELDGDGLLHFTAVELDPRAELNQAIGELRNEATNNDQVIPIVQLDQLIQSHQLKTKQITVQSVLG